MDALVSSDGFAVVSEPTLSSLSIAVMIVDIKGANNNNARYYCLLRENIPGSGVPGSWIRQVSNLLPSSCRCSPQYPAMKRMILAAAAGSSAA